VFYRTSVNGVTQAARLEVLGPDTSGEVEPVVLALPDGMWLGVGSDHTDPPSSSAARWSAPIYGASMM
jgi:hypothetical protein